MNKGIILKKIISYGVEGNIFKIDQKDKIAKITDNMNQSFTDIIILGIINSYDTPYKKYILDIDEYYSIIGSTIFTKALDYYPRRKSFLYLINDKAIINPIEIIYKLLSISPSDLSNINNLLDLKRISIFFDDFKITVKCVEFDNDIISYINIEVETFYINEKFNYNIEKKLNKFLLLCQDFKYFSLVKVNKNTYNIKLTTFENINCMMSQFLPKRLNDDMIYRFKISSVIKTDKIVYSTQDIKSHLTTEKKYYIYEPTELSVRIMNRMDTTLNDIIKKYKNKEKKLLKILFIVIRKIVRGLKLFREAKIIHYDLHFGNIMLNFKSSKISNKTIDVKIIDLGLCCCFGENEIISSIIKFYSQKQIEYNGLFYKDNAWKYNCYYDFFYFLSICLSYNFNKCLNDRIRYYFKKYNIIVRDNYRVILDSNLDMSNISLLDDFNIFIKELYNNL